MTTTTRPEPPALLSTEHERDPYATYRILREHYPVHHDSSADTWLVSRMDDVRTVFGSSEVCNQHYTEQFGEIHGRTIIEMDGAEHSAHRKLLTPYLHSKGLEQFLPTIRATAEDRIDPVLAASIAADPENPTFDLVAEFAALYPIDVTREILGAPCDMEDAFKRWHRDISDSFDNLAGSQEVIDRAEGTRDELEAYFGPLIRERRGQGGTDLVSLLADAEVGGLELSDQEIRAFIALIIVAGVGTPNSAVGSTFKLLIEHPEQMEAVYEDRSLLLDAFAEQLRHSPPIHIIQRVAVDDIELDGGVIPEGATIGCMLASANRDETKFDRPDEFDIFRTDNNTDRAFRASADHVSFATGRHFCVGNALARDELEIAADVIFGRMDGPPRFADGFTASETGVWFRAPAELRLTFTPLRTDRG
jgi:pulcherriminic acid synthase